jgi:DeoR/GlpR family transcriptional regulator of sugar metabolism
MGVCGIDAVGGVTTQMLAEADVKRAAAKAASRVIAVADASKIGRVAFGHVCDVADLDVLITDTSADDVAVNELIAAGVDVRRA